MPGHNAYLHLVGRNKPGAIGAQQQRAASHVAHRIFHAHHIKHRNAFGNAHHKIKLGTHRLQNSIRSSSGRHINDRNIGAGRLPGFSNGSKNRNAVHFGSGLAGVDACYKLIRIGIGAARARMKGTRLAGHALRHHARQGIDKNAHVHAPLSFCASRSAGLNDLLRRFRHACRRNNRQAAFLQNSAARLFIGAVHAHDQRH